MEYRKYIFYVLILLVYFLLNSNIYAQDPQFTQFYGVSTYLNPALTGNTIQHRITLDQRVQWPALAGAYNTFCFSYDRYFSEINSGFGLLLINDQAGTGNLRLTSIGGLYSYNIHASRTTSIRLGIQLAYVERTLDYQKLTFTDQIIRGGNVPTVEVFQNPKTQSLDNHVGVVVSGINYWVGASVKHLTKPNESLLEGESRVPVNFTWHGGYNHVLKRNSKRQESQKLTFAFHYKAQEKYDQFDVGVYYTKYPLVLGTWYRGLPLFKGYLPGYPNHDAWAFILGLDFRTFRIGYSYDATISKLALNSMGAHEIALIYEFASAEKRKKSMSRRFVVPCAKF